MQLTPNQLKWVEALESGEFKQDELRGGYLIVASPSGEMTYCCLGVACELAAEEGVTAIGEPRWRDTGLPYYDVYGTLPIRVQEWLGVGRADPIIGNRSAVDLNDVDKMSFKGIAAEIRKHGLR